MAEKEINQYFEDWFEERKERCEVYGNGDDFYVDDEIKNFCKMGFEFGYNLVMDKLFRCTIQKIAIEKEKSEAVAQLWGAKSTCNNCGNIDCENYQRQRKTEPCDLWISYKDKFSKADVIIRDLLSLLVTFQDQIVFDDEKQKIKKAEEFLGL